MVSLGRRVVRGEEFLMPNQPLILPDLKYDCLQCGKGCRVEFGINVTPEVEMAVRESDWGRHLEREGYRPVRVLENGFRAIGRRESGECVLLRPDNLCAIHAEKGLAAKPRPCRQFPFHPINTPDGVLVGLSFFCSAVQRDHGRPLSEQLPEIENAVGERFLEEAPAELGHLSLPVGPDLFVDWKGYLEIEKHVLSRLSEGAVLDSAWRAAGDIGCLFLHCMEKELPFDPGQLERQASPDVSTALPALSAMTGALISLVEAGDNADARAAVSESYSAARPFYSSRLGREMTPRPDGGVPDWFDGQVRRYFEHVVFRKFLAHGPALARTTALCSIYQVLRFYTLDAAAGAPQPEHLYRALDIVESELMLHADGVQPLYDHFQYVALQILTQQL